MLQGGFAQQEWRVGRLLKRLMDFLRPYLTHPYQNVRDRIGSVLTSIYLNDIEFGSGETRSNTRNPSTAEFMAEVTPQLELLREEPDPAVLLYKAQRAEGAAPNGAAVVPAAHMVSGLMGQAGIPRMPHPGADLPPGIMPRMPPPEMLARMPMVPPEMLARMPMPPADVLARMRMPMPPPEILGRMPMPPPEMLARMPMPPPEMLARMRMPMPPAADVVARMSAPSQAEQEMLARMATRPQQERPAGMPCQLPQQQQDILARMPMPPPPEMAAMPRMPMPPPPMPMMPGADTRMMTPQADMQQVMGEIHATLSPMIGGGGGESPLLGPGGHSEALAAMQADSVDPKDEKAIEYEKRQVAIRLLQTGK